MRRPIQILMAAGLVLLLVTTIVFFQKYQRTSADFANLKTEEEDTRARYSEALGSIAAIHDHLNAIVLGDEAVGLRPGGLQAERALTPYRGDEVMERIAVLKAGIERAKVKIEDLDATLKKNGVKIEGLQRMVANLRHNVTLKEERIAQLVTQVDSLQTQVTGLTADVEDKRRELGTVYYVIGTKKDLTTSGLVVAEGGILGIGKTLKPSGTINGELFTAMDTDVQSTVVIPAAKVQVLSAQPVTSYELRSEGNQTELHILDPKEFRTVKHLVIMTMRT